MPVVTGASTVELLLPLHVADAQLLPLCSLVLWVLLLLLLSLQLPCRLLRLPAPSPSQRTPKARIALAASQPLVRISKLEIIDCWAQLARLPSVLPLSSSVLARLHGEGAAESDRSPKHPAARQPAITAKAMRIGAQGGPTFRCSSSCSNQLR